jgi:virginiamycin A acetyltransferase
VVAAHSVVSADVPPYAIVAGNPAKVVRRRFSDEDAARLQAVAWWDRPIERITAHLPLISGGDIAALEMAAREG